MPIEVGDRRQPPIRPLVDTARLVEAARVVVDELDAGGAELAVALVDDAEIRGLNRDYRATDAATDVLAFAQREGEPIAVAERAAEATTLGAVHLGDVVISVETAERQAGAGGWTLEQEINRLLVHGVLHLLGYDHVGSESERARMQAAELRLAEALERAGFACAKEDLR